MSVQSQIDRISANIAGAYTAIDEMGGTLPEDQVSENLAAAVRSIPANGGGDVASPLDPLEVYKATRPSDWLPMPEPQANEMYLLFHIPDGASSLLAFTVTCEGSYTVATGTVENGAFVQSNSVSIAGSQKYEAELFADDYGSLTSTGMKQCMIKVSGSDIIVWEPSVHSKKMSPANFSRWDIVEISCRLPKAQAVRPGNATANRALARMRYFSCYGENRIANTYYMFGHAYSLIAIPYLDTSYASVTNNMFYNAYSLIAIPQLNTSKVTTMTYMFYLCHSIAAIPQIDTSKVTSMGRMFYGCYSLAAIPQIDTSSVTDMTNTFFGCSSLTVIPQLDTSAIANMSNTFDSCYSLAKITLNNAIDDWIGYSISLANCSLKHDALVDLFNSLPALASVKALTLTGNPGVSELTDSEKAIATGKNWTLTL